VTDLGHLSIGEVLAQLLDEFPEITISKIRFLESQGLIGPERTPSGYRKFTPPEVERLRVILREQKENFLPLRVIRERLDDETSDLHRELSDNGDESASVRAHPAARASVPRPAAAREDVPSAAPPPSPVPTDAIPAASFDQINSAFEDEQREIARMHADRTESLPRDEMLSQMEMSETALRALESAGLVGGHDVGDTRFYDSEAQAVVRIAKRFEELGIEIRHLRTWKLAVDKEVALFEQRMLPMFRQRSMEARREAISMLEEMIVLGGKLRGALLGRELKRFGDGQ
jgi:DNA-binding transcriptional MerR regulator